MASAPLHPAPLFIAGPTAVGKSDLALLLAERLGGEIISVDSMQVYRGLDIGTAKPSPAERQRVPHHLLDVIPLDEPFDAARFVALASEAVREIHSRGHTPIFCGGTGLYFNAYLDGLGEAPPSDPRLRTELENTPLPSLLDELAARDPTTWERIDRQNPRRVIRAIEVIRLTGKPFSSQRAAWPEEATPNQSPGTARFYILSRQPDDLHTRIELRVDQMFARGLVAETENLLRHGLAGNRIALQAIGYRQVVEHLRGERGLSETIALVKTRTRQFAKRQMTWFRRRLPGAWIEAVAGETPQAIASRVEELMNR